MKIHEMFTDKELAEAYYYMYQGKYEFNKQNTKKLYKVIDGALSEYRAVSAFRLDLHFPSWYYQPLDMNDEYSCYSDNSCMKKFIYELTKSIESHFSARMSLGKRVHHSNIRYVWAREQYDSEVPHYHVLLLLNRDAYRGFGHYMSDNENLAFKIQYAWMSTLGIIDPAARTLVHFPDSPVYVIERQTKEEILPLLLRSIYLTKEQTKLKGLGFRCFGGSNS